MAGFRSIESRSIPFAICLSARDEIEKIDSEVAAGIYRGFKHAAMCNPRDDINLSRGLNEPRVPANVSVEERRSWWI